MGGDGWAERQPSPPICLLAHMVRCLAHMVRRAMGVRRRGTMPGIAAMPEVGRRRATTLGEWQSIAPINLAEPSRT